MYNERGFLKQVNNKQGNLPVWELLEVNSKGQPVEVLLGNGLSTYRNYDTYGFLTSVKTGITETTGLVQDYTYQFAPVWGRPEWRNNAFAGQEDFYYDEDGLKLNRLTSVANNTGNTGITYAANGNIATKTGLGGYGYQLPQPHAVSSVENTEGILPETRQDITYTYFNKAETITEGEKQLLLTYGTANQRVKTEFYNNQILEKTKYFASNYELEETPQGTRELNYIAGPMGMAAIFVKENGTEQMYYTHSDHLGSLTEITDNTGTLIQRVVYNAWGQRELLVDNTATEKFLFDRGFTGHEHLDEFALINMNGRMYDPILGSMLSPDNYVQNPYGTQGFNRYSYAGNNPLIYTDPTGEFIFTALLTPIGLTPVGMILDAACWGGAIDLGIQGIQIAAGTRENISWAQVGGAAVAGAVFGGMGILAPSFTVSSTSFMKNLPTYLGKAGWAGLTGIASSGAGMLATDLFEGGGIDYSGEDYLKAMGAAGAFSFGLSFANSIYDYATWDKFTVDQKLDILKEKYNIENIELSEKAYSTLDPEKNIVYIGTEDIRERGRAFYAGEHESGHIADFKKYGQVINKNTDPNWKRYYELQQYPRSLRSNRINSNYWIKKYNEYYLPKNYNSGTYSFSFGIDQLYKSIY